ncbi:MAG: DUF2019 domain-containing protein [Verrucomicrobiales bacterium]|nr:DUF2019 domain-containing protein [Verrucomicrobiales bacterium]
MRCAEIIRQYATAAEAHGEATDRGDHKATNRAHDQVIRALRALRKTKEGDRALLPLLKHTSAHVRTWAATHLLPFEEEQAVAVLESVGRGRGFTAFDARMTLQLWKKGELKLP